MVHVRLKGLAGVGALLLLSWTASAKKAKRWTYPRPQWPVPEHSMDAEPCRLFLWNMASAVRFCQCSRILESTADKTLWEDTHGQLWLRIPFSSPLLRLFPCQQHSLTRCAKCGHEFRAHVEVALKKRGDRPYDKLLLTTAQQARRNKGRALFQDYRGAAVFAPKKKGKGAAAKAAAGGGGSSTSGSDYQQGENGGGGGGGIGDEEEDFFLGWRRRLAVLAEAQRATLLQLSGVQVTSATARAAFDREKNARRKAEAAKEKKVERRSGRGGTRNGGSNGGGGGGSTRRYQQGGRDGGGGVPRGGVARRGGGDRARRGGGVGGGSGRHRDSRGKGETEDEVAERNLRAFDRMEYI